MNTEFEALDPHAEWLELCALETTGTLVPADRQRLQTHLETCPECRDALANYHALTREGMSQVAEQYFTVDEVAPELRGWNAAAAKQQLFSRLDEPAAVPAVASAFIPPKGRRKLLAITSWSGLAAGLAVAIAASSYQLGKQHVPPAQSAPSPLLAKVQSVSAEKVDLDKRLASEEAAFLALQEQTAKTQDKITALQAQFQDAQGRADKATNASAAANQQLQATITERDGLTGKLENLQQAYQLAQTELTSLKTQRQRDLLHYSSLEVDVNELTSQLHNTESRVNDDTQYLASDRDIRELMGARQLYIADVTDVDGNGHARKAFGRVFYTKGKSLIFYAFDLDRQPGLTEASTFQAWAREGSDTAKPISLGIFYMDNEANRRWILKTADPKLLAQVNAVFVTVEPKGGSEKPSGKQLLYAYLRAVAPNHP